MSGEQRYARRGGGGEERADLKIENDDVRERTSEEMQELDVEVVVAVKRLKRRCGLDGRGEERRAAGEGVVTYG